MSMGLTSLTAEEVINSLDEKELFEISKNSILKNTIKKIELNNFVEELKVDDKFLSKLIVSKYSKIGINSLEKFETFLKEENLDIKLIKEKFYIELIWNDYIYQKFYNKVIIDREKIEKEILSNPKQENQRELLQLVGVTRLLLDPAPQYSMLMHLGVA